MSALDKGIEYQPVAFIDDKRDNAGRAIQGRRIYRPMAFDLSGLTLKDESHPEGDIEIVYTGLRPGEKLYEELLIGDNVTGTSHPKISMAMEHKELWDDYRLALETVFEVARERRFHDLRNLLASYVNGFSPSSDVVDWMDQSRPVESKPERGALSYH
ncbi:polysaccharide biosynthesis protein [Endozoicomonas sp. 4G]|uniref:polysaccharide biosynthesis protein n=1 Tax=Endozoicomonas sp. 4G TaxID=2872754 RepID=UPI00320B3717